ncbi:UNVERIFIED_CONTAM: transposase InsO family protein [Streptomyces canus]
MKRAHRLAGLRALAPLLAEHAPPAVVPADPLRGPVRHRSPGTTRFIGGTDLSRWSADELEAVAHVLNNRPRKILGWKTPAEVFEEQLRSPNNSVLQRPVESKQYTSFTLAEHLEKVDIAAPIGSVGDAYDNALMESTIGLFKTEVIKPQRPWRSLAQVELATAE